MLLPLVPLLLLLLLPSYTLPGILQGNPIMMYLGSISFTSARFVPGDKDKGLRHKEKGKTKSGNSRICVVLVV